MITDEQFRALTIVGLLLAGVASGGGYTAGRLTAPAAVAPQKPSEPEIQYRIVEVPVFVQPPKTDDRVKTDAKPRPEPKAGNDSPPTQRPVVVRPQPQPKPKPKAPTKSTLPSCAVVQREYESMTWGERMRAYRNATSEQIAHGRRCLGM